MSRIAPLMPYRSLGLAPMEGVTEFPTRLWLWLFFRPDFLWTPFLRVTDSFPHRVLPTTFAPELAELRAYCPYPLIPQIMASDRYHAARAGQMVLALAPYVDLNCGCPAPKVVGHGAGSSLLENPDTMHAFLSFLSTELDGRLSVKTRLGFNSQDEWARLLPVFASLNLVHLTVHGRSRPDKYLGTANWQAIRAAAASCPYPVLASGDLFHPNDWAHLFDDARLYAAITGRGALRFPWLFGLKNSPEALPFKVSSDALLTMFTLYHHWQGFWSTAPEEFVAQWAPRYFLEGSLLLQNPESLAREVDVVSERLAKLDVKSFEPRQWLGRLKMMWQSLRSSFPPSMADDRSLLRSATLEEFQGRFRELASCEIDNLGQLSLAVGLPNTVS